MPVQPSAPYAGDVSAEEAHAMLEREKDAVLVDVRTKAEWAYVGVPDLSALGKRPVLIEWQEFPSMKVNAEFGARLEEVLREQSVPADAPLLFLCRSGARSRAAAVELTKAGRSRCFNIESGFEGPLDDKHQRGAVAGWKARGLPWAQS